MMLLEKEIIEHTITFVQKTLDDAEVGHDWSHIQRVWHLAKYIAKQENADPFIVELGALLHDIADAKFHNNDETIGPAKAETFLYSVGASSSVIEHVGQIVRCISFKGGNFNQSFDSLELYVCMDADRLDAMGAIGIARAFSYGGFRGQLMYDPLIPPRFNMTPEEYRRHHPHTINHFYEKLFLLKDLLHTQTAKHMAQERHLFMEKFVEQFLAEWNMASQDASLATEDRVL